MTPTPNPGAKTPSAGILGGVTPTGPAGFVRTPANDDDGAYFARWAEKLARSIEHGG